MILLISFKINQTMQMLILIEDVALKNLETLKKLFLTTKKLSKLKIHID